MIQRRALVKGVLSASGAAILAGGWSSAIKPARAENRISRSSGFDTPEKWAKNYENRWGLLGPQSRTQIENVIHAEGGVYNDKDGVFAWIVHYWLRAWSRMAELTGEERYLETAISFIDYMFDHTDEMRIIRGEISEDYVRDPGGFQGTGKGGPFWKRGGEANALNTGMVAHGILRFVDTLKRNEDRWPLYHPIADRYFEGCLRAVSAFDNDWKEFGQAGSYYYRDSQGSNVLGTTETAFNQSATMCAANLYLDKWRPDPARRDKVQRLLNYWTGYFVTENPDGTLSWPYIIHDKLQRTEDTGHATVDLDFLTLAHAQGYDEISDHHMAALAKTFSNRVWNSDGSLNTYVDGETEPGYREHFNAGFGWFELSRRDPGIARMALQTYERFYPVTAAPADLWARPFLGWANLLDFQQ